MESSMEIPPEVVAAMDRLRVRRCASRVAARREGQDWFVVIFSRREFADHAKVRFAEIAGGVAVRFEVLDPFDPGAARPAAGRASTTPSTSSYGLWTIFLTLEPFLRASTGVPPEVDNAMDRLQSKRGVARVAAGLEGKDWVILVFSRRPLADHAKDRLAAVAGGIPVRFELLEPPWATRRRPS